MPPSKMVCNGIDLSTYAMWVETPRGWADAPVPSPTLLDLGAAGQLMVASATRMAARRWTIEGVLLAASAADAKDQWDAAKLVLADSWLEVMILPWTDRVCHCQLAAMEWTGARLEDYGWRFRLAFLAPSAHLVAPQVDTYGLGGGDEVVLALGTVPAPFRVDFIGPSTSPTLSYYSSGGELRGTVRVGYDLATGDWWSFDSQTYTMRLHMLANSAVQVSDGAGHLHNSSRLFQLDPRDGSGDRGPTLALDSGYAVVYVRKAYG